MDAVYVSTSSFKVVGDLTAQFIDGRKVRADCGVDGDKIVNVASSSYSSPDTTVTVDESTLTANLAYAHYGVNLPGSGGSLPKHGALEDSGTKTHAEIDTSVGKTDTFIDTTIGSTANGDGASLVGIEDVADNWAATNVEDWIIECLAYMDDYLVNRDDDGNALMDATAGDDSENNFVMESGADPTTFPADTIHYGAKDQAAGNACFTVWTELGDMVQIYQRADANQAAVAAPAAFVNTNGAIGGLTISAGYSQAEVQALRDACEVLADDCRALQVEVTSYEVLLTEIRTLLTANGQAKGSA